MSEKFKCYNSIQYVKKHKSSSNLKLPTTFFFLFFFCAFYYVSNALHHFLLRYFRDFFTIIWRSFFFLGRVSLKTCFDGFPYFNKKDFFLFVKKKFRKTCRKSPVGFTNQERHGHFSRTSRLLCCL